MKTELLNFEDEKCVEIVRDGDVLAFPTETVFGFGVRYDSLEAFNKLCALKQRTPDKPFTIMVSDKKDIGRFVDLNDKMERLIDTFMPGEVTFLFPAKKDLAHHLTLSSKSVGIRIAALKEVPDLIARVGVPMLVTSANLSSEPPLLDSDSCLNKFDGKLRGVVKGKCHSNLPSTIILIDGDELKLIRQGSLNFEEVEKVWNK